MDALAGIRQGLLRLKCLEAWAAPFLRDSAFGRSSG